MMCPLDWAHLATEIAEAGVAAARNATAGEREALAQVLDLLSCESLTARYEIVPLEGGRFRLSGGLEAEVVQACVVSLEPVTAHVAEAFCVEFRTHVDASAEGGERQVLEADDVELFEGGRIDAGRIIFETLSASLDPYPRKPGAEFQWRDPGEEEAGVPKGPFAALAKLKRQQ